MSAHCSQHAGYSKGCSGCQRVNRDYMANSRRIRGVLRVDATGARRRLQALAVNGWTCKRMAASSGLSRHTLYRIMEGHERFQRLNRQLADRIAAFYEQVWDVVHSDPYGKRTSGWARRKGWVPPMAWDDIDDDHAPDDSSDSEYNELEEYVALRNLGLQHWEIAQRFGIAEASLRRRLDRAA